MTEPERVRLRRRVKPRRFYDEPRVRYTLIAMAFGLLIAASIIQIFALSPRRKKYRFYQQGLKAYEAGQHDKAKILFRRYLSLEPSRAEAWYMLGLAHFRVGEDGEAVEALLTATKHSPELDLAQIALSEHFRKTGDYRAALDRADRAIATDPVPASAWVARGDVKSLLGDLQAAVDAYQRAIQMDPELVEIHLKLGDLHVEMEARRGSGIYRGLADQDYGEAEKRAKEALERNPLDARASLWFARASAGLGDLEKAIDNVEDAVEREPEVPEHRLLLAAYLHALGKFDEERAALESAIEAAPAPLPAVRLSWLLVEEFDDPEAGRLVLERAIERHPDSSAPRIALVAHHRWQENLADARVALDEAIERFPRDSSVLEARGDLLLAEGNADAALDAYAEMIETHPQSPGARRKLLSLLMPTLLEKIGNKERDEDLRAEAVRHLDFFLDPDGGVNPGDRVARGLRARLAFAEGDFDTAADFLGRGTDVKPDSYEGLKILGISCLRSSDYRDAANALYDALEHPDCPGDPSDHEAAYGASLRVGHVTREIEAARGAVEKWPEDSEWRLRLATSLFRDGQYGEAARECGRAKGLLAGTNDVRAHLLAARIYQASSDLTSARAELESAVLIRRDAETRGALYSFFAATGQGNLARDGFRSLIEEDPDDPAAYLRFGEFLMRQSAGLELDAAERTGILDEALAQFERAKQVDPSSREAIYQVAELRMAKAVNTEEAIAAAEEAVALMGGTASADPYGLYFKGKLHLLKEETDLALDALARYTRESPNDAAGLYYLGVAERRSGALQKAKKSFLAALALNPNLVEAKLQLAVLFFSEGIKAHGEGDLDGARSALESAAAIDPNEPETRRFLADTLYSLGMADRAEAEAERVLKIRPDDLGGLFLSGALRAQRGDFEAAEKRFLRLVELEPGNFRSHLYLGMVVADLGRHDEARERLLEARKLSPEADEVLLAIAFNEMAAGREDEAVRLVEQERERRPDRAFVHHLAGDLYRQAGRTREAVDSYQRAFALEPGDYLALSYAAAIVADEGEPEKAIALLAEGALRSPAPARIHTLEGRMHLVGGDRAAAESCFLEALAADPKHAPASRELGILLATRGRGTDALKRLEEAVDGGVADPAVHFHLARLAAERGDKAKAERSYREVLNLAPGEVAALNNLALLLSANPADVPEAVVLAAKARELSPEEPQILDTYGWVLFRAERFDEAVEALTAAAKALPDDPSVLAHAGLACHRAFSWEKAKGYLTRALELSKTFPEVEEARNALQALK